MDAVRVEIAKLELKPGDILVVRGDVPCEWPEQFIESMPEQTHLWFVPKDWEFEVIRPNGEEVK